MNEPSFERIVSDLFAIKANTVSKYEVLLNTNVTLHSENEILAEYKTRLEAKEASELESEGEDPKKKEEFKKIEAMHKRQLTENRKLRKENKDLKKKLAEIRNENAKQTEHEHEETVDEDSTSNQNRSIIDQILAEPTQCEIPELVEVKQENEDAGIGMVNLAQSTSSLNITRNIQIGALYLASRYPTMVPRYFHDEKMRKILNPLVLRVQPQIDPDGNDSECSPENHSANNATVKIEPDNPSATILDENLPSTSGTSIVKTPKKTRKINANTKRTLITDISNEHDIFINSKSPRLRLISD